MPSRSPVEALEALDTTTFRNRTEERDYIHEVVGEVTRAVDAHAELLAQQAAGLAARFDANATEMDSVSSELREVADAVKRGDMDPLVAQQRWRALQLRKDAVTRIVDEQTSDGHVRLQEQAVDLLGRMEDPLGSLDALARKYASLLRNWQH